MKPNLIKWAIPVLLIAAITSCNSETKTEKEKGYSLYVDIQNSGMDTAYLYMLGVDGWEAIDSTQKNEKGKFNFNGTVERAEYMLVGNKDRSYAIRVFVENSPITIKGNFEEPGTELITGSGINEIHLQVKDSLSIYDNLMESIVTEYRALEENGDSTTLTRLGMQYDSLDALRNEWLMGWTKDNLNSVVAQYFVLSPLSYTLSFDELKEIFDAIPADATDNHIYTILKQKVTILENSAVGKPAPDFTMADTTGKMLKLSDYFGTYLLIDFWASWCGPCRADNPQMVDIYKKYHGNGYNVFGVSLDAKKDRWMQAIDDDKLDWTHVSDLQGWSNAAAKLYGVNSIPHTVLLNPDGVIIARGLRTEGLDAKLAEIFADSAE